ncbi:G-protein coupled receptor 183-like [Mugil cephalus]|uniref:G-protein coupled receptor 183-like n=1 Tax=Mugil cephalus TaxID=48193 RepID=UPI001FB5A749|nr:G-protein coupled receptor 183-like [Mugil cephalus]
MTVNNSTNNSTDCSWFSPELQHWKIIAYAVIGFCCVSGIPANIAVIVKLSRHLRGSSISQRLFFHLALSDLLCLLCLPVGMVILYRPRLPIYLTGEVCQLVFYVFVFCINTSLNILVLISIQRYYQVIHPQKWEKVNRTWQRILLSSVWILGGLMALPVLFFLTKVNSNEGNQNDNHCENQRVSPVLEAIYIGFVVFSHLVLLSCYLMLVKGVHRKKMSVKKKPRVTRLFIRILFASLIVGFLPLILRVFYVFASLTESEHLLCLSRKLTFVECFYFLIYCMNPFLYFFSSRHQRRESFRQKKRFLMPLDDSS